MKKLVIALLLCLSTAAPACTNLIVSKGASTDGSTFITYAADSHTRYGQLRYRAAADHQPGETVKLYNYGSLFIGGNTAEVFGDYASGTNHTLPTIKAARYTGGVYVGTFLKVCTHQSMTPEASRKIAPLVNRMAHGEGLEGHAEAAKRRF